MKGETIANASSTMFGDFIQQLEKERAELHSTADKIEIRLHKVKNTNFPQVASDDYVDKNPPRGNDDLEYELFDALESLTRLRKKLQESLEKLETII